MATIEILSWKDHDVGFTGWDDHARSELKKRLRRGINASPSDVKSLTRQILARGLVSLHHVHDDSAYSLIQILETTGAEVRLTLGRSKDDNDI